jgi:hypothetical protein
MAAAQAGTVTERQWPGAARSLASGPGPGSSGPALGRVARWPHWPVPGSTRKLSRNPRTRLRLRLKAACERGRLRPKVRVPTAVCWLHWQPARRRARSGRPGTGLLLLPPQAGGLWRSTRSAGGPALGAASESEFESGISASQSAVATGGSCGACQCQWSQAR